MSKIQLAIEGSKEIIEEVHKLNAIEGVQVSKPVASDRAADPLDSPIGADEIKQLVEIVTAVAESGTAITLFLGALRNILKKRQDEGLLVRDPVSGKELGRLTGETSQEDMARILAS